MGGVADLLSLENCGISPKEFGCLTWEDPASRSFQSTGMLKFLLWKTSLIPRVGFVQGFGEEDLSCR
jgi:hypothetical protein